MWHVIHVYAVYVQLIFRALPHIFPHFLHPNEVCISRHKPVCLDAAAAATNAAAITTTFGNCLTSLISVANTA